MILALALAGGLAVTGLDGQPLDPFRGTAARPPAKTLVFVFVRPDCPVSNRYVPELNRIYAEYRRRGVNMWLVYSGVDRVDPVRAHHAAYGLSVPALIDRRLELAGKAGATMTPEVAVYTDRGAHPPGERWGLVYRGRIDDRAPSVGIWRPLAAVRDLADVLQRLDNGELLTYRTTQAVGCYLKP